MAKTWPGQAKPVAEESRRYDGQNMAKLVAGESRRYDGQNMARPSQSPKNRDATMAKTRPRKASRGYVDQINVSPL